MEGVPTTSAIRRPLVANRSETAIRAERHGVVGEVPVGPGDRIGVR